MLLPSTPWTRGVYSDCVTLLCTAEIPAGTVVACSTRLHQTSSIDTIHLVMACIHHDVDDPTVRCLTSFNYASLRYPLNHLRPKPTSFQAVHVVTFSELFSSVQRGSFTPDEVIDLRTVPRTATLAHMLRTSLQPAISCLALQTWLVWRVLLIFSPTSFV